MTKIGCGCPLSAVAGLLLLTACSFKGDHVNATVDLSTTGQSASSAGDRYWHPAAVKIRVYPATRFAQVDGKSLLHAKVELLDEMGDSVKSSGHFFFEIYSKSRVGAPAKRLDNWNLALTTLQHQELYYEPIIRAYDFTLELSARWPSNRPGELRVIFTPPMGKRLETAAVLTGALRHIPQPIVRQPKAPSAPITPDPDQETNVPD